MYERLKELLKNSSSRYYNFRVSAVLVCKDETSFDGVNVETSSPSAGICAERNALYSSISKGKTKEDFKELHIMVDSVTPSAPCFICRQALVDFLNKDTNIYMYSNQGLGAVKKLEELTPFPFDDGNLK